VRQSWTQPLANRWFYLPLPLLGVDPLLVATADGVSALYQFFIHTELVGRLGPLEAVLNTPSHHRVHHATNGPYLDKNHGGILIVWDRLFGTFAAERADLSPRYGLVKPPSRRGLLHLAFHGFGELGRAVRRARSLGPLFARP
jgi:alkylglycerol monooxygenase